MEVIRLIFFHAAVADRHARRHEIVDRGNSKEVDLRVDWKTNLGFVSMFDPSSAPIDDVRWPMDTDFARRTIRELIFDGSSTVRGIGVWLSTCLSG